MIKRMLFGLAALSLACPPASWADPALRAAQDALRDSLRRPTIQAEGASATGPKTASRGYLLPRYPYVGFGTIFVSADALCVDGESLRPINPWREVCAEWGSPRGGDRGPECVRTQKAYLSTPIRYKKKECVEWKVVGGERGLVCVKEGVVDAVHNLKPAVEYWEIDNSGEGRERLAYTKTYEIPACR